jgi:hypothetical protein
MNTSNISNSKANESKFFTPGRYLQATLLTDAIKRYFHIMNERRSKVSVNNPNQMATLFAGIISYITISVPRFSTLSSAKYAMDQYLDIKNSHDLAKLLVGNSKLLKKCGYACDFLSGVKSKEAKVEKHNFKLYKRASSVKDVTRSLVVRSQFGNYPPVFFQLQGAASDVHKISALKMAYKEETGCPFFQARPILMTTWVNLSEAQQHATCAN